MQWRRREKCPSFSGIPHIFPAVCLLWLFPLKHTQSCSSDSLSLCFTGEESLGKPQQQHSCNSCQHHHHPSQERAGHDGNESRETRAGQFLWFTSNPHEIFQLFGTTPLSPFHCYCTAVFLSHCKCMG